MSTTPTPYTPGTDFEDLETNDPELAGIGSDLDTEFANIAAAVRTTQSRLAEIQRDDGALKNAIVTPDSLSPASRALLAGTNPRGDWATATAYKRGDLVAFESATYAATADHTSGTFTTDLAAGRWLLIASPYSLSSAVFSQTFDGDGTTTVFSLSQNFTSINELLVFVQDGAGGYDLVRGFGTGPQVSLANGNELTFSTAPANGTRNILVLAINQTAATSAAAAEAAQEAAEAAQAAAEAAQAAAETAETNAEAAETNAETAATNASNSATSAASSAVAAQAAASSIGFSDVVFVTAADSPVTLDSDAAGKLYSCDTSGGAIVFTLPQISGLTLPWNVGIKKSTADTNSVTVNRAGTDTIDGNTSLKIGNVGGARFVPDTDTNPDLWTTVSFGASSVAVQVETFTSSGSAGDEFVLASDAGTKNNIQILVGGGLQLYKADFSYDPSTKTVTVTDAIADTTADAVEIVYTIAQPIGQASALDGSLYASQAEAEAGTDNAKVMTALRTKQQVDARLASQAEAEAGTDSSKLMTPLRVAQSIEAAKNQPPRQTTYATNTDLGTDLPDDDTIPTSTEGDQVMSDSITLSDATKRVKVTVFVWGSATDNVTIVLLRDGTVINVGGARSVNTNSYFAFTMAYIDSPASASALTYSVRVGAYQSPVRLNGTTSSRRWGGAAKCTLILEEVDAS